MRPWSNSRVHYSMLGKLPSCVDTFAEQTRPRGPHLSPCLSILKLNLRGCSMTDFISPGRKYTAIWQAQKPIEEDWIKEILGPIVGEFGTDGKHELVLDNAILLDSFVCSNDAAYYEKFRGRNAFLVHFLDESYAGRYDAYHNFRGVIRCFWARIFDSPCVMEMPLGYSRGLGCGSVAPLPATQRAYVLSFAGATRKATRPDAVRALAAITPHFLFSTDSPVPRSATNPAGGWRSGLAPRRFPNCFPTPSSRQVPWET
jgi:hypothetical protein